MRRYVAALLAFAPSRALADVEDWHGADLRVPAERRSDVALIGSLAGAGGIVSGTPNEIDKIDVARWERSLSPGAGWGASAWLGVALRDWLVLAVGTSHVDLGRASATSSGGAIGLRLEAYPAYGAGRVGRDLGVLLEAGAGWRSIEEGGRTTADGGSMSFVGAGVVWEPLRLGAHGALGPTVEVCSQLGPSLSAALLLVGARVAYYGGPG